MKFKRLNEDKLQIIISRDDFMQRNMKRWDLVPHNPVAQKLFQDILDEAYDECGFEVAQGAQLMIEAYPMTGESMVLTVTKVTDSGKGLFDFDLDIINENFLGNLLDDEEIILESEDLVYGFRDLEDAIQLAKLINNRYEEESTLYKCGNSYYLVLENMASIADKSFGVLSEYGESTNISSAYMLEHGQEIIAEKAIGILARL